MFAESHRAWKTAPKWIDYTVQVSFFRVFYHFETSKHLEILGQYCDLINNKLLSHILYSFENS